MTYGKHSRNGFSTTSAFGKKSTDGIGLTFPPGPETDRIHAQQRNLGYEYLERRFNLATHLAASILFMLYQCGRIAVVLYLPALALWAPRYSV